MYFQTDHFVESLNFRLMYRSKHELSSKKILKNIKYWQRNGGFKFWPEVKITRLIDMYLALFSRINIFTWSGHCKKLKLIGNLSDCLQILTVGRLTHKQQKWSANFFFRNIFTMRAILVRTLHIFLILFRKCSVTFHWNWIWQIANKLF